MKDQFIHTPPGSEGNSFWGQTKEINMSYQRDSGYHRVLTSHTLIVLSWMAKTSCGNTLIKQCIRQHNEITAILIVGGL